MEFLQNTFVSMFNGSPEKALRAVLAMMGCYVLTAAPLVAWVLYGLFQKESKVCCTPSSASLPYAAALSPAPELACRSKTSLSLAPSPSCKSQLLMQH